MKYMLLIYSNPEAPWTGSEEDYRSLGELFALRNELAESGELVAAEGLGAAAEAKTIRVRDGIPIVTDGPFVEAKEHLAGFFLIDCDSLDRAVEIAAHTPVARSHAIELRTVMHESEADILDAQKALDGLNKSAR